VCFFPGLWTPWLRGLFGSGLCSVRFHKAVLFFRAQLLCHDLLHFQPKCDLEVSRKAREVMTRFLSFQATTFVTAPSAHILPSTMSGHIFLKRFVTVGETHEKVSGAQHGDRGGMRPTSLVPRLVFSPEEGRNTIHVCLPSPKTLGRIESLGVPLVRSRQSISKPCRDSW
jgi:hypothetical protein